mmetsp:Transcript_9045/g.28600  ORF Transcript_9045/g.28600 Transcript_9045/m.28600 type:complete len:215 (+) Transcript_9045:374-1018(+)
MDRGRDAVGSIVPLDLALVLPLAQPAEGSVALPGMGGSEAFMVLPAPSTWRAFLQAPGRQSCVRVHMTAQWRMQARARWRGGQGDVKQPRAQWLLHTPRRPLPPHRLLRSALDHGRPTRRRTLDPRPLVSLAWPISPLALLGRPAQSCCLHRRRSSLAPGLARLPLIARRPPRHYRLFQWAARPPRPASGGGASAASASATRADDRDTWPRIAP